MKEYKIRVEFNGKKTEQRIYTMLADGPFEARKSTEKYLREQFGNIKNFYWRIIYVIWVQSESSERGI